VTGEHETDRLSRLPAVSAVQPFSDTSQPIEHPAGEPSSVDLLSMQAQTAIEHPDDSSDGDLRAVLSTPVECADCGDLVDVHDLTGYYCPRCAI